MPHALVIFPTNSRELNPIVETIENTGFTVSIASSFFAAKQLTQGLIPSIVFAEANLGERNDVRLLNEEPWTQSVPFVFIGDKKTSENEYTIFNSPIKDFLCSPIDPIYLKNLLIDLKSNKGSHVKEEKIKQQSISHLKCYGLHLVGQSPVMNKIYSYIERVAPTMATVLISGPSGSGKELVAKTIHEKSTRAKGPYIAINCGAIPKDLISSALFGHEKGSFTGALQAHQGYFEQASGGTIFLDEVTETLPDLQIRLLRVLETGKVIPVGGKRQISVDVRVIAATNRDPSDAIKENILREDIYYRLNTFPLSLPPLCQRAEDIELLVKYFLEKLNKTYKRNIEINSKAMERLEKYVWPGNVRELNNVVQRAYILSDSIINDEHIIFDNYEGAQQQLKVTIGSSIKEVKTQFIKATYDYFSHDIQKTADTLQMTITEVRKYI
ncbi:MAG: Anaerobic nitric oxide reductase transcription regulator NorR [Legionellaceae bacterium]